MELWSRQYRKPQKEHRAVRLHFAEPELKQSVSPPCRLYHRPPRWQWTSTRKVSSFGCEDLQPRRRDIQQRRLCSSSSWIALKAFSVSTLILWPKNQCPIADRNIERIGKVLSRNFDKLPAKTQQLGAPGGPGDLLQRLDRLVRDHVLDDFLQEHPVCRRQFSQLFGCRYPHLRELDSNAVHEATDGVMASSMPVEGLQAALDERLKGRPSTTEEVTWQPVVHGESTFFELLI